MNPGKSNMYYLSLIKMWQWGRKKRKKEGWKDGKEKKLLNLALARGKKPRL